MLLKELFPDTFSDIEITGIATDTRFVQPGFLFLPLAGKTFSGEEFIIEAVLKGASAIVAKEPIVNITVPVLIRNDLQTELLRLLHLFYGKPYDELTLIGVTGTDGKTTIATLTSYLLDHIHSSAYIGTNGIHAFFNDAPSMFTTPLLAENFRLLREFADHKVRYATMEVSSQGIANHRIETLCYDYAIFSNLSHEHLDTHKTMTQYFLTKLQLFKQMKPHGIMIINKDDNYSKFFHEFDNVIYYSLFNPSDYHATNIRYYENYTLFDLLTKEHMYLNVKMNRTEEYNIYNVLPAIIIALKEGLSVPDLYTLLADLPVVPGRLEKVPLPYPFHVYIDFAHTPNALRSVLSALKRKAEGKVILVCGAAGKKDKTKRPLMGKIACEIADYTIFTSEDPRCEDPNEIIDQMISEIETTNYIKILKRTDAIEHALRIAKKDDTIVITGKGRETYFEENNVIYQYSDFDFLMNEAHL